MGYKEEIFDRLEKEGFRSFSEIQSWLSGTGATIKKKRSAISYRNFAVELSEPFAIMNRVREASNFRQIALLEKERDTIKIDSARSMISGEINERMRVLDGEADKIAEDFKSAETESQRERAEDRLRELSPQSLGGIKSGEKRRAPAAFRAVFG